MRLTVLQDVQPGNLWKDRSSFYDTVFRHLFVGKYKLEIYSFASNIILI